MEAVGAYGGGMEDGLGPEGEVKQEAAGEDQAVGYEGHGERHREVVQHGGVEPYASEPAYGQALYYGQQPGGAY